MTNYYRDFYGGSASIKTLQDGSVRLIVYDGHGRMVLKKSYASKRGARIAMSKLSDGWHEHKKG